jgi:hypothetical protein
MSAANLIREASMTRTFILAACLGLVGMLPADQPVPSAVGVVTVMSGKVSLYTAVSPDKGKDMMLGQQLHDGDRLKTGANGRAALVLVDGTQLRINYNTDMTLKAQDTKGKTSDRGIGSIKVTVGEWWAKVTKKNSHLEFDTPSAVAAVKGTEINFAVDEDGSLCAKLREGKLDIGNDLGSMSLTQLQQACLSKGQKPSDSLIQKWDGKGTFEGDLAKAQAATVEIDFKDHDSKKSPGKIVLQYSK